MSCCGYGRPTPHIDALAADGVRFSRAYASNTPCMPARAALFTGCFGVVNGVETHGTAALSVSTIIIEVGTDLPIEFKLEILVLCEAAC